jgi:hypothetical protein
LHFIPLRSKNEGTDWSAFSCDLQWRAYCRIRSQHAQWLYDPAKKTHLEELDVQRINVVEPDGTLRMVISDKAHFPGAIVKGKEYSHERPTAGMLFYNDEGSETGGLSFAGYKSKDGKVISAVHLSFDRYMQDQVLSLDAADNPDGTHSTGLALVDRPDYPITELIDLMERTKGLPKEQQEDAMRKFRATHPDPQRRLILGRIPDGAVMLGLNDAQGHPRIVLKVSMARHPSRRWTQMERRLAR